MKNLCRAIIWSACFLEMSDDETVDPDSAVKAFEDIASALLNATDEEKQAFATACEEEASALQGNSSYNRSAKFIRELPATFGL